MAGNLHLTLVGDERLVSVMRDIDPRENPVFVRRALVKGGLLIQRSAASKQIERGGKGAPLPDKLTSRTGTGRRSIRVDRGGLSQFFIDTGSDLRYMLVHETGGTFRRRRHTRTTKAGKQATVKAHSATFPERPWLQPALDDVNDDLGQLFVEEWRREVDRR